MKMMLIQVGERSAQSAITSPPIAVLIAVGRSVRIAISAQIVQATLCVGVAWKTDHPTRMIHEPR